MLPSYLRQWCTDRRSPCFSFDIVVIALKQFEQQICLAFEV
jgi:hypothetical protein